MRGTSGLSNIHERWQVVPRWDGACGVVLGETVSGMAAVSVPPRVVAVVAVTFVAERVNVDVDVLLRCLVVSFHFRRNASEGQHQQDHSYSKTLERQHGE